MRAKEKPSCSSRGFKNYSIVAFFSFEGYSIVAELAPASPSCSPTKSSSLLDCGSVAQGLLNRAWVRDITIAFTVQVLMGNVHVWSLIESLSR